MTSIVEHVFKNIRYKLVRVDGEYYVLDMDRPIWSILFPFLYWFMPHTVYQIDYPSFEKLKMPNKHKGGRGWMIGLATGASVLLAQFLMPTISDFNSSTSFALKLFVLIVSIAVIIAIRGFIHTENFKKINAKVDMDNLNKRSINVRPAKLTGYLQLIVFYFFFLGFSILGGLMFFEFGNILLLLCFIPLSLAFLAINTIVIPIGAAKVTLLKDKKHA